MSGSCIRTVEDKPLKSVVASLSHSRTYLTLLLRIFLTMKISVSAIALTALVTLGEARHCQNLTIPIEVSARQPKFNLQTPNSNIDVTNFILDLTRQGHNYSNEALTGVSGFSTQS